MLALLFLTLLVVAVGALGVVAYQRFLGTVGASDTNLSGWMYWRLGEGGPLLDSLRA